MSDGSKATPRPWRAYNNGVCWQIDGELNAVVTTQFCYSESPEANAALIVAAVNGHDALMAEHDRLRQQVEDLEADASNDYGKYLALKHDYDRLRQALKEAQDALRGITWQNSPSSKWSRDRAKHTLARIRELMKWGDKLDD